MQFFLKYILLSTQIDHHLKKWCNNQYNRWMEMQITSYFQSVFDLLYLFHQFVLSVWCQQINFSRVFLFEHRSRSVFKILIYMIAIRLYFIYSKKIIFYPVVHFFKIHLYYNLLPLQTQNVYAYLLICSPFLHYFSHKENTLIFHKFISIYL